MGLQYQVDSLEGLDDSVKALYTEKDGKFVLGVDGLPQQEDVTGLKTQRDSLLNEKKTAQDKATQALKDLQALKDQIAQEGKDKTRKSGDIDALEASWKQEKENSENALNGQISKLKDQIYNLTVGQAAEQLAGELAIPGSASVLLPHIKNRLVVEESENGEYKIRVVDLQGNPTALTLDSLKKELAANPAFKPLIAASNASGGGANGGQGGGATKKPSEYTETERAQMAVENPTLFKQLFPHAL